MRHLISISLGSFILALGSAAFAQTPPAEGGGTATGTAGGTATGTATVSTPTPPTVPAPAKPAETKIDENTPDHERVIKKFAVGYLGFTQIPLSNNTLGGAGFDTVQAPVIGARYWLMDRLGIDVGLGLGILGGGVSNTAGNNTTDTGAATAWGFAAHVGVPLTPAWGKHYTLLLIPELNFGVAGRSIKPPAGAPANSNNQDEGGTRFSFGARGGAEVHFGFIGVPELSLQGTIGFGFQTSHVWTNNAGFNNTVSNSGTVWALATSVEQPPWAIFTNNISALYYFP
jgi:hypothetical protein